MANTDVREHVRAAVESASLGQSQGVRAGKIIAQFLIVREGLEGRIPEDELSATAAALTVGIWTRPER